MPVDRDDLKESANRLRIRLFGHGPSDQGFVGIGASDIHVYVHGTKRAWANLHISTWEGYTVTWRYKVGPIVAFDVA